MKLRDLLFVSSAVGAGMLVWGTLVESRRLVVERKTLPLPGWPERLRGYRIGVLGDLHLRDEYSVDLAKQAVAMLLDESPDMVALVGDYVGYWKDESLAMLRETLEPLLLMDGNCVAIPGNHDYLKGNPTQFTPLFEALNIRLLRNESWRHAGITWVGIDSFNKRRSLPDKAFENAEGTPTVVLWHEPDLVDRLPQGAHLQLSGHSHGGQFRFPGGFTPMHSRNGERYVAGFYPHASTPLYVTRGVGTTGPPSRFNCPPEVTVLTLVPG